MNPTLLSKYLWVANSFSNTVLKINIDTKIREVINVGEFPVDILFYDKYIWVVNALSGTVSKIDMETNLVTATIKVGMHPQSITFHNKYLWVTNNLSHIVCKIDPAINSVTVNTSVCDYPDKIISDGKYILANSTTSTYVNKVEPDTIPPSSLILIDNYIYDDLPHSIVYTFKHLWIHILNSNHILKSNSIKNVVSAKIKVRNTPYDIIFDDQYIWVANTNVDTASKIDPVKNADTLKSGSNITKVVYTKNSVWISYYEPRIVPDFTTTVGMAYNTQAAVLTF